MKHKERQQLIETITTINRYTTEADKTSTGGVPYGILIAVLAMIALVSVGK